MVFLFALIFMLGYNTGRKRVQQDMKEKQITTTDTTEKVSLRLSPDPFSVDYVAGYKHGHSKGRERGLAQRITRKNNRKLKSKVNKP